MKKIEPTREGAHVPGASPPPAPPAPQPPLPPPGSANVNIRLLVRDEWT